MSTLMIAPSNVTAPTQFLQVKNETYAYRRFGGGGAHPLVFLQHFTGTLDNWDPAVTDPLASGREVSCSTTRVSDAQPARSQRRSRGWRHMHSLSWMRSASNAWICLVSPSVGWSRRK